MYVVIGDRRTSLVSETRQQRSEYVVEFSVDVLTPGGTLELRHRNRITTAVRAIREVLETTSGRELGALHKAVLLTQVTSARIAAMPMAFGKGVVGQLFDVANLTIRARVYIAPLS
jgi:hypothetical protein